MFVLADVKFEIGGDDKDTNVSANETPWICIWSCELSIPVYHMSFSPDGTLFATSGLHDRLVKIWFGTKRGNTSITIKCVHFILIFFSIFS